MDGRRPRPLLSVALTRMATPRVSCALARAALAIALVLLLSPRAQPQDSQQTAVVDQFIGAIIRQTAAACPLASPSDQAALDRCRIGLYGDSAFRKGLAPIVLWGRPSPEGRRLRDTNLTQFAPDVLAGLYMPMFMFTGEYDVSFDSTEKLYRARAPALFRNAMDIGQYPYPFWHDPRKWNDYQAANELTFWVDPSKTRIVTMQFSARGKPDPRLVSAPRTPPPFDGKWMWTDSGGQSQPRPALFVGLLRSNNPYLGRLESAYRDLATELRKGTCNECHAPDNYAGTKRLVLMQTPVHAAGEIKRMMRAVRDDKMPLDDVGLYKEIDPAIKAALLKYGATFESLVDAARDWEQKNP